MEGEDAVVEDDEAIFQDQDISNKNPAIVSSTFGVVKSLLESYGWFILIALVILWYLKGILEQKLQRWQQERSDAAAHRNDSAEDLQRQESLLAARARLQQKYDEAAAQFAEQQRLRQEEEKKQKLADWESYLRGGTSKQSRDRAQFMGRDGGFGGSEAGGEGRYRPSSRRQGRS